MHWKIALCSLSIGISTAPPRRAASMSSAPAMTSDSLLATSTCLPARAAASVDGNPAAPTMAAMTTSTSGPAATAFSASTPQATAVGHPAARRSSASNCAAAGSCSTATAGRNRTHWSSSAVRFEQAASAVTR